MRIENCAVLLVAAMLTSCAGNSSKPVEGLVITNAQSGLMRKAGADWIVYEPGSSFKYAHNGECVANYVRKQCMWYGVTFDYVAPRAGIELACKLTRSRPQSQVNPRGEQGIGKDQEFRLRLPLAKGRYEGVGYQTPKNELPGTLSMRTVCSYGSQVLLDYTFAVTYSESDIANAT